MAAALIGAGIGGLFGAYAKSKEIEANNKAAVSAFKATDNALTITQGINWRRASEATRETAREANIAFIEAKADITKAVSKTAIQRGEGVTAGISAARTVSNVLLQSSKAIEGARVQTQSKITDMWAATEDTNYNIQQQKKQAYNKMRASLVTGSQAFMSVIGAAISGAQTGASLGNFAGSLAGPPASPIASSPMTSPSTTNQFNLTHSDVGF